MTTQAAVSGAEGDAFAVTELLKKKAAAAKTAAARAKAVADAAAPEHEERSQDLYALIFSCWWMRLKDLRAIAPHVDNKLCKHNDAVQVNLERLVLVLPSRVLSLMKYEGGLDLTLKGNSGGSAPSVCPT